MTEYTAQCRWAREDRMVARIVGDSVHIDGVSHDTIEANVSLQTAEARTFARGILALADEIDKGEATANEEAPAPARVLQLGDRVRIVRNAFRIEGEKNVGRVGTLSELDPDDRQSHRVSFSGSDDDAWWCAEVELVDEPEPAPADEPTPSRSSRAKYVEEARELLRGTPHDASDLTRLAEFLADGE